MMSAAHRAAQVTQPRAFPTGLKRHDVNRLTRDLEGNPWTAANQTKWKLIILFQHNVAMLKQSVKSYQRASTFLSRHLVIIDNSNGSVVSADPWFDYRVEKVVTTPYQLTFADLQNYMADRALEWGLELYFWAHADVYVMAAEPGRDMGLDMLDCLRSTAQAHPKWGVVFYSYDHLAAFRTQAMVQVPWDPNVFQYGSDIDEYARVLATNYTIEKCAVHYSFDQTRVLPISDVNTWHEALEQLELAQLMPADRNNWRESVMTPQEKEWRVTMGKHSGRYLGSKWPGGLGDWDRNGLTCARPWPYCPAACPPDLPWCLDHGDLTPTRLEKLRDRAAAIFERHRPAITRFLGTNPTVSSLQSKMEN